MKPYLALARVSNLPTIWTNVLAGVAIASPPDADFPWVRYLLLAAGMSLVYCAGMVFNDVADVEEDTLQRPGRPIPSGAVSRVAAASFGAALVVAGVVALIAGSRDWTATVPWIAGLLLAILYYDLRHRTDPLGPVVMGACRGLVYCVAAAAAIGRVHPAVVFAAAVVTAYVVTFTMVAKFREPEYGWTIKWWIAGICLVDAFFVLFSGSPELVVLALAGFPATIAAQRLVAGT